MGTLFTLLAVLLATVPVLLIVALVMLASLRRRVHTLELAQAVHAAAASASEAASKHAPSIPESEPSSPGRESDPPPLPESATPTSARASQETTSTGAGDHASPPPAPPPPGPIERALTRAWGWLVSGNVPVKVGMLVLLAGIAALLKYAGDQGWMRLPMELRLAGISATALAALVFAWHKRERQRVFALALQGGALGVLLLVVFAAFKSYDLIGAGFAFALSVVLIASGAVLAVMQNARALAVFSILAGFTAPIWLSDGSGNHVALFSWYALLNAGVFAIAWVRPWRSLNLLGFTFTWGIGTVWGVLQYDADKFATTQPFLALFFAFYLLLPLLYARKETRPGSARVDASLLFGTPLIAFSLQAGLLEGEPLPLALCALGVAAVYALLGWGLIGRERLHRLAQGYAILAVGFATLAVPLGLSGKVTAAVFALEGAGLVWLGWVQQHKLARISGLALQGLAALFWCWAAEPVTRGNAEAFAAITNADCMGGLMLALAGFIIAWLYRQRANTIALGAYLWALAWWLGILGREILDYGQASYFLHDRSWPHELNAFLLLFALTGWLAAEAHRHGAARALNASVLGSMLCAGGLMGIQHLDAGHPFAHGGGVAWGLFALMALRSLVCLRPDAGLLARLTQLAWWLLGVMLLSLEAWYFSGKWSLGDGWRSLATALPWLVAAALSLYRWRWVALPLGVAFDPIRPVFQLLVLGFLGLLWLMWLSNPGSSAPLPWVAVLNPLDLAQIVILLLAGVWLRQQAAPDGTRWTLLAVAAWLLLTVMTLRAVHHWGGVAWWHVFGSVLGQSSLTVVWSILGVLAWVLGSRRGRWGLWLGGALLLLAVLLKLLVIDRSNLGNLYGIGAVIAYGLFCTLVGWLAPAPPRRAASNAQGTSAS